MHPVSYFCSSATYCTSRDTASWLRKLSAACTQTAEGGKTSALVNTCSDVQVKSEANEKSHVELCE